MRIEINLSETIAELIKQKARRKKHSRKSYIEFLCIQDIESDAISVEYKPMLNCMQTDVLKRPCYTEYKDCQTCEYLKRSFH